MRLVLPRLYAIMDGALLPMSELALAEMLAQSGVELIQYRNKQISSGNLFQICKGLASLFTSREVRFIVNDRPDIAALVGAGGVHVGQEDLPVERARAICGPGCWVGVSTHSLEQVLQANGTSADYIAVGPIFSTTTKEKPDPIVGLDFIRQARALTSKPLVAIGGITLERAADVWRAGADSIAVAHDLLAAPHPGVRAREYLMLAAKVSAEAS